MLTRDLRFHAAHHLSDAMRIEHRGFDGALLQQELGTLVSPIRDTLVQVDAKLKEVEKSRVDDSANMKSLLTLVGHTQQQLQHETQNLVRALRSPGVRGQWGEVQLRKVVELAGMLEHCDFDQQPTIFTEGGRLRPDMTINLPGGRSIVVDAKAPLEAFLDAQAAAGHRFAVLGDFWTPILERVREVARGGTTIILITHHIEEIVPEIEHVVFVRQGAIVADGTKHDILTSERLSDVFQAPITLEAEGDGYYYARPKARSV